MSVYFGFFDIALKLLVLRTSEKSYFLRNENHFTFFSFTAINGTGERISHAVGTAFQACLAKKQEIEKVSFCRFFSKIKFFSQRQI